MDKCVATHCWWGRSALLARAGFEEPVRSCLWSSSYVYICLPGGSKNSCMRLCAVASVSSRCTHSAPPLHLCRLFNEWPRVDVSISFHRVFTCGTDLPGRSVWSHPRNAARNHRTYWRLSDHRCSGDSDLYRIQSSNRHVGGCSGCRVWMMCREWKLCSNKFVKEYFYYLAYRNTATSTIFVLWAVCVSINLHHMSNHSCLSMVLIVLCRWHCFTTIQYAIITPIRPDW